MFSNYKRKYTGLTDPEVVTAPFKIELDNDKCVGCGLCVRQCPCQTIDLVERDYSEKQKPACQSRCPAGTDIRKVINMLSEGESYEAAWKVITKNNPMPAITGRVCPGKCEEGCNRQFLDDPVNINSIEKTVGDHAIKSQLKFNQPENKKDKDIAVIGSGPSGMSCAFHLANMGYAVTIYESKNKPGGMLRYAIPSYRLPDSVIDDELNRIIDLGIDIKYNVKVGIDIVFEEIRSKHDAVYLAVGAQESVDLKLNGEEAPNVYSGLDFLDRTDEKNLIVPGKKVVVIGGGNTAFDVARLSKRYGSDVSILYRRTQNEMPASNTEINEAREEGIRIEFLTAPVKINVDESGKASSMTCTRMQLGDADDSGRRRPEPVNNSEFEVKADTFIKAIGQGLESKGLENFVNSGWLLSGKYGSTSETGVFAGGDAATGPATVSEAIGAGQLSAVAIDAYVNNISIAESDYLEIYFSSGHLESSCMNKRETPEVLPVDKRFESIDREIYGSMTEQQVLSESKRCLECGKYKSVFSGSDYFGDVCIGCHNCEAICPHGALKFPHFYRVEEGRFATTGINLPGKNEGYPNPFNEEKTPDPEELLPKLTQMEEVIYTRRSNRVFKPDQIPEDVIHRILEAGRFAPSAGNCQPWQFLVVRDRELMNELSVECCKSLGRVTKLYQGKNLLRQFIKKSLALFKPDVIDQRPMVAINALIEPKFGKDTMDVFFEAPTVIYVLNNQVGISTPIFSTGMCCQNMVLTAHALGLGTCYSGFASEPINLSRKLRKKLGIKWPYNHVATAITIGYPAAKADKIVEREFPTVNWIK